MFWHLFNVIIYIYNHILLTNIEKIPIYGKVYTLKNISSTENFKIHVISEIMAILLTKIWFKEAERKKIETGTGK